SQADILIAINQQILDAGLDEEATISRSGLSRHAQKTEAIGKRLRELRATTQALTAELGDKPTGDTTKMILEMGRSQLFSAMQKQMLNPDEDDDVDIGMIKDAMLAAQRLESTAMAAHKREKDIR
ncbi:phage protein Gp27 family protein, partial [Pseudoalteromonas sp. MMG012]